MNDKPINHYRLGSKFLEYCVKHEWLRQEDSCGRKTKWYLTEARRSELKNRFEIEL